MAEAADWLNQNQGAAVAVLTFFLVLFNAFLLLETRAARSERLVSNVVAYPMPFEMASMYLAGRFENSGPAVATNLEWTVTQKQHGKVVDEPHRYAQHTMLPGRYRTMMMHERGRAQMLRDMGNDAVTFDVKWSWKDGRRWFGVGPHRRHERTATWETKQLAEDFYQALVLTETPPMLRVGDAAQEVEQAAKEVKKIREELQKIRKVVAGGPP